MGLIVTQHTRLIWEQSCVFTDPHKQQGEQLMLHRDPVVLLESDPLYKGSTSTFYCGVGSSVIVVA